MNINEYFTKVKIFTNVFAFIRTFINDEDLVAMTLNYPRKDYNQFQTLIVV
jgi:hypothetical protein